MVNINPKDTAMGAHELEGTPHLGTPPNCHKNKVFPNKKH